MHPPPARAGDLVRIIRLVLILGTITALSFVSGVGASVHRPQRDVHLRHISRNIAPNPNFMDVCYSGVYDISGPCFSEVADALQHALSVERVPVRIDLAEIERQSPTVQLFIAANIDRVARGLAPVEELVGGLDSVAARGVALGTDPALVASPSPRVDGESVLGWGSNWGRLTYNALGTEYFWMYEDGPHGYNVACDGDHEMGCMGHRTNILATYDTSTAFCANGKVTVSMGAAFAVSSGAPSFSEIFIATCRAPRRDVIARWSSFKRAVIALR